MIIILAVSVIETSNPLVAAQISGFVWQDNNGNGLLDAGEQGFAQTVPGFGAANIALYPADINQLIDVSALDENSKGRYSFDGVADGEYYLCVSNEFLELGLSVTAQDAGDDSIDSDFDFSPCSYAIVVSGGEVVIRDLGLKPDLIGGSDPAVPVDQTERVEAGTGIIKGLVWLDRDGDGRRAHFLNPDYSEIPIKTRGDYSIDQVTMELYRLRDETPVKTSLSTVSDATTSESNYLFENLPAGEYFVCAREDYLSRGITGITLKDAGSNDDFDNDFNASACTDIFTVNAEQTIVTDLGLVANTVNLIRVEGSCALQNALDAARFSAPRGGCPATNKTERIQILLEHGSSHPGRYGIGPAPDDLSGRSRVFISIDGEAFVDTISVGSSIGKNEPFVNIKNLVVNNIFASSGMLRVSNVTVNENISANGEDGGLIFVSNSTLCGSHVEKRRLTKPFGSLEEIHKNNPCFKIFDQTDNNNTVSGFVWLDDNGNGLQDAGEAGFAQTVPGFGAPNIALYPADSTELLEFSSLDESSHGVYSFENVADGEYYLCVSREFLELDLSATTQDAGDDSIDSDFDSTPCSYGIVVSGGQVVSRDLGLTGGFMPIQPDDPDPVDPVEPTNPVNSGMGNTISGFVWLDSNGDGLQSVGEIGFAQTIPDLGPVIVELYDADYNSVAFFPLNESSNGRYQFNNLAVGTYNLCVSQVYRKLKLFITQRDVGDDDTIDSDFFHSGCVLEEIAISNQQGAVFDMGLAGDGTLSGATISGFVGNDRNNNGFFDDDERVATVVTLTAYAAEKIGQFIRHAASDSDGFYEFTDLPTGQYIVCVDCEGGTTIVRISDPNSKITGINRSTESGDRNIIKVDGSTCTLQQALDAFTLDKQVGSCVSTDPHDALIVLKSGSVHPAVDHVRFPSQLPPLSRIEPRGNFANVKIYGNGARIESFTSKSDPVTYPTQRLRSDDARIINASLGSVTNDQSFVLLRHVTVDNEVATIGERGRRGTTPVLFSTIGSAFGHSVFLQNSHVLGDALETRGATKSVIDGTLSAFSGDPLNPVILRGSTITRLKLSPNPIKIETSLIGGIFIDDFEGKGSDLPGYCFDTEGIINPHCLLN